MTQPWSAARSIRHHSPTSTLIKFTSSSRRSVIAGSSDTINRESICREFGSTASTSKSAPSPFDRSLLTPRTPLPFEAHSNRRKDNKVKGTVVAPAQAKVEEFPSDITAQGDDVAVIASEESFVPPPLTNHDLSLLYAFTAPPPLSALAALANRLALSFPSSSPAASLSLVDHLPLLEQCLIHESFWMGVKELAASPIGARRIYTRFHDAPLVTNPSSPLLSQRFAHNGSLATLGNALLGTLASELILSSFPNLPTRVAKATLTMYVGPKSLAAVATSWGVGPSRLERRLVGAEDIGKQSKGDRAYGHLVGGVGPGSIEPSAKDGAAGMGLVRWNRRPTTPTRDSVLFEDSLASVSRAVIGAVYQLHGFAATRAFVHSQFLARLIASPTSLAPPASASADISPLLKFSTPSKVLSLTCSKHRMPPSRHLLLKESGRLSSHPTFLSGVFSGERKLGEGFGSSIKMSEFRASEDALRRLYLGGRERNGLPSDVWSGKDFEGMEIREAEVDHESKTQSKKRGGVLGVDKPVTQDMMSQ